MKIVKFGGKSLDNGLGIEKFVEIIRKNISDNQDIKIVVSARGNATDDLLNILEKCRNKQEFISHFDQFKKDQVGNFPEKILNEHFLNLQNLFEGVSKLGDYSDKIKAEVIAHGELIAAKWITHLLVENGIKAQAIDSRQFITTNSNFLDAFVNEPESEQKTKTFFSALNTAAIPVITGFIGANSKGETTTLGRNGSNYSAALIANFLDAEIFENYTHVDGIYTADPVLVEDAFIIDSLSYEEANEMVNFGSNVLHAKTIIPLISKGIPVRILNTFKNGAQKGTLIQAKSDGNGVRALSALKNKSLIHFTGRGLLGKVGVDSRIFNTLSQKNVNVNLISQGSSERSIGIVVNTQDVDKAIKALETEFRPDILTKDVERIFAENDLAVISIVGEELKNFDRPFQALIRNQIIPILFNNTISGKNISLLIRETELKKSLKVLHGEMFKIHKTIHLALFGKGQVGQVLIDQLLDNQKKIVERKNIDLKIFAISNSQGTWIDKKGLQKNWEKRTPFNPTSTRQAEQIISYAKNENLENLIIVDNTASKEVAEKYIHFVENGFDIVSSNKIYNTLSLNHYKKLREKLKEYHKTYLYETNVGAGLPLIDNIKLLHLSGDNILKIRGVFSGSLSYIFNTFSENDVPFSKIVVQAKNLGYTEPDPREDLGGNDVARKLLILARELDFDMELSDVEIENLIPASLTEMDQNAFLANLDKMDTDFQRIKHNQLPGHVLRYIGELEWNPKLYRGNLKVKLDSVPKNSILGRVSGSDSIFEIYTESYGKNPVIIQGAGAGAQVTARGVFGDILKISEIKN